MLRRLLTAVLFAATLASAQPRRIVSTAPSITEILYAIGLGERVVGVTTYCHYPPDARTKPKIGTYIEPNLETIASLRPDLVIIQKNPIHLADKLQSLKLKVLEISHDTLDEVYVSIQRVGDAAGASDAARKLVARLHSEMAAVRKRSGDKPARRMMFVVGRTPGHIEGVIAVGSASYLNGLIEAAGGTNIFKTAAAAYPKVGLEEILSRNPQVIVDMGDMSQTEHVAEEHKRAVVNLWRAYPSLDAVKNGRVFAVASDIFTVPGPRMAEAARAFAEMLAQ